MREISYSLDSLEKLQLIKADVSEKYGEETALETVSEIMDTIDLLADNPELGDSVSDIYNIPTEYRRLYSCHNNVFYCFDKENVFVIEIYHEKEDFIAGLFGNYNK